MRYSKGHKEETRRRVLETASRRFRKNGVEATGVAALMAEAGLTHGGFYAHFASKDALVTEALGASLDRSRSFFNEDLKGRAALEDFVSCYLSPAHRDHPEKGCVAAALASEIARLSPRIRTRFTASLHALLAQIAQTLPPTIRGKARLARARALFALLAGALQFARAVNDSALSDQMLVDARQAALALAGYGPG